MHLSDISVLLNATVLTNPKKLPETDIPYACASDILSDVLAYARPDCILLTCMRNLQVIRTACMKDIPCIIFTGGKIPGEEMLQTANELSISLMVTPLSSFETSGILYQNGLRGIKRT